jgi:hypothetical protein
LPKFDPRGPPQRGDLLASVDLNDNAVSLYAYRGGQFVRVGSLATGTFPTQIVVGDLIDNGYSDLVVLDAGDGTAAVYLGNGIGGFAGGYDVPIGPGASAIALADVDGTRHLDLVVTNQVTGLVTVYPGNGDATFGAPSTYPAGAGPYSINVSPDGTTSSVTSDEATAGVAIGTFTRNAPLSLTTIDPGTNTLTVLAGLGSGALANAERFLTSTPATVVRAADFNGDGLSDLAVLGPDGVTVYLSDGAGRFSSSTTYYAGPNPTGLAVADVDGSGHADLLVGDTNGDVLVLVGNGDGTFQPYRRTDQNEALAVLPTSGSTPEFIFADQGLDRVVVKAGGQSTELGNRSTGILDPGPVQLADLNGNGIPDLIVINSGGNNVLVYPGLGNGQFGPELNGGKGFFTGTDPVSVTVADVNGDGRPDLIVANKGSNDVTVLRNEPTADGGFTFVPSERLQGGFGPTSTAVQYVNSMPEILVSDGGSNQVTLLPSVGHGLFNDQNPRTFPVGRDPTQVLVGNFLPNQGLEILTVNTGSNDVTVISDVTSTHPVFDTFLTGGLEPVASFAVAPAGQSLESLVVANGGDGLFTLLGGTEGLEVEATLSNPSVPEPTALDFGSLSGNELTFYAATAGMEAAFTLAFTLPGFSPSTVPVPGSSSATVQAPALLVALSETSLPLAGSLLVTVLNTSTSTTLAAAAETQAEVNTSFLSVAPSQGQGLFTQASSGATGGDDDAAETESATPAGQAQGQAPAAPPWVRSFLGTDDQLQQIRQESQDALFKDEKPAGTGESAEKKPADPLGLRLPSVPTRQANEPTPGPRLARSPGVDRTETQAIDEAIASLWAVSSIEARPAFPRIQEPPRPAPLPDDPEPRSAESIPIWLPPVLSAVLLVHASPLTETLRDRRRGSMVADNRVRRSSRRFIGGSGGV